MRITNIFLNSIISTKDRKSMGVDIKSYYLTTPMNRPTYIFINITDIPDEIVTQYNIHDYFHNGKIFFKVTKGIYGLPQAGRLENDRLQKYLKKHGYTQNTLIPDLLTHETNNVEVLLWVDEFLVKYTIDEEAHHFLTALLDFYTI